MKIYSKLALILGFAMAFVACSNDDDKLQPGTWDGSATGDIVYFAADSLYFNEILDPTSPTTKTFNVHRRDTVGNMTVKFKAIENTNNMFVVSDAVFADGESDATFTVDFSKAEADITYKLVIQPETSSSWATNGQFAYTLLIEKWDNLGVGLYTDDLVCGIFSAAPISYEVEILEKASKPGMYRLVNAYGENYPYNEPGDWDDSKDYLLEIDATDSTAVSIAAQPLGLDWGYGMFWVRSVKPGTLKDGIITFPVQGFHVLMESYNDGAWSFYGNNNEAFAVVLPEKYKELQEAQSVKGTAARIKVNRALK